VIPESHSLAEHLPSPRQIPPAIVERLIQRTHEDDATEHAEPETGPAQWQQEQTSAIHGPAHSPDLPRPDSYIGDELHYPAEPLTAPADLLERHALETADDSVGTETAEIPLPFSVPENFSFPMEGEMADLAHMQLLPESGESEGELALEASFPESILADHTEAIELSQPAETPGSPEQAAGTADIWLEELRKDPETILNDFTETLTLTLLSAEAIVTGSVVGAAEPASLHLPDSGTNTESLDLSPALEPIQEPERPLLPAIAAIRSFAEKLPALEPEAREEAALILQQITGAIHAVHLLQAREAGPERIAGTEEVLTELCRELYHVAGIDCTDEDIRHFTDLLLRPDFHLAMGAEEAARFVDLTIEGTREAKLPGRLSDFPLDKTGQLRTMLGTFALFYSLLHHRETAI
jgi:hypothetical protein